MPGRKFNTGNYRFGFNGMEKNPESCGCDGNYTTHYRALDTRIGRWLSVDPVTRPNLSPYNSMDNNPILLNDPNGNCPFCPALIGAVWDAAGQVGASMAKGKGFFSSVKDINLVSVAKSALQASIPFINGS
jgi:RHS repeat-associated protein